MNRFLHYIANLVADAATSVFSDAHGSKRKLAAPQYAPGAAGREINLPYSINESARIHAKRNAAIQIIIATIVFIMLMRVFPYDAIQRHYYSRQNAYTQAELKNVQGDAFTKDDKKLQTVYFSREHLFKMKLYLSCTLPDKGDGSDFVLFRIYDEKFSCVYEEKYCCGDIAKDGFLLASPNMDVEIGKAYYYEIIATYDEENGEYCDAELNLPVADRSALSQTENGALYIDGIINEEVSLIADFDYSKKLTLFGIIICYAAIIAAAAALYIITLVIIYTYDICFSKNKHRYVKCARLAASIITLCFAIFLLVFCVVLNRFGGGFWDRLFFAVGITVGAAWLMLAIWLRDICPQIPKMTKLPADRKISLIWRNYIQTVSFGLLFYALCQYVNADREYYHYTNTRWMLIFFAIALLMMYNETQFLNKLSALWLAISAIGSWIYCRDFEMGTKEQHLAVLTCAVVASWGLLVTNVLIQYIKSLLAGAIHFKKPTIIKGIYGFLWILFSAFMYMYRFEKTWVFTAVLPFALMLFMRFTPEQTSRLLKNFTNGILLSFGFVALFCFVHRPHHYWMLYRYGGIFHTVACTGMYLAVVFGAALGKLLGKLKDRGSIITTCPFECFLTSAAAGYVFLTMSRTAYLAVFVTAALSILLAAAAFHKRPLAALKETGVLIFAAIICFPLVFGAVRMIPAVINKPVRYDLEHQDRGFMIYRGDPIDSDKYMTVPRFFSTLFGRFIKKEDASDEEARIIEAQSCLVYTQNDLAGLIMRAADNDDKAEMPQDDASNGRFQIFADYLKALSFKGHEKMAFINENGTEHVHAHNSYLQIAYNFGIIAGLVFLLICAISLYCSMRLAMAQGQKFGIYIVPFALIIVFGLLSLTEWAFHPCIPTGFAFIFLQPLLIRSAR